MRIPADHAASCKERVLFLVDQAMPGPAAGEKAVLSQAWLLPYALANGWREADLSLLPTPHVAIAKRLAVKLQDVVHTLSDPADWRFIL